MLIWFLPLFLIFLMIGLPVVFGLLAAPGLLLWLNGQERDITLLYRNVYNGMDSFPLMAIPFFMLAGELMNRGGITMRLVEFAQALMGHFRVDETGRQTAKVNFIMQWQDGDRHLILPDNLREREPIHPFRPWSER